MKIGDKVKFLSETGGGVIAGFQGKNIVLVEDEDGFQIPTNINDVIVAGEDNYEKQHDFSQTKKTKEEQHDDLSDKPITFSLKPEERKGGDVLSVYLVFVPIDIKEITHTRFETYIVNDSNYYINYTYATAEGTSWQLRSEGKIEPNTKVFIEEFGRDELNNFERVAIQLMAYKCDKSYMLKPTVDVQLRLDTVKFYKLHTFRENDFFEQPALINTIIENDKPVRTLVIDPKALKEEMANKIVSDHRMPSIQPARKKMKDEPIVTDLHASELLDTMTGLSATDILNYQLDVFRKTMDEHKNMRGKKLIFIHGKGEGVLRNAVITELKRHYKNCVYQDASFREYGYGATQVMIK